MSNIDKQQLHKENMQELAKKEFEKYKISILPKIIAEFGDSYDTVGNVGDTWIESYKYTKDREIFLKLQSKCYFWNELNQKIDTSFDEDFLEALTEHIAKYLSGFTVKSGNFRNQNRARKALFKELIKSSYIEHARQVRERKAAARAQKEARKAAKLAIKLGKAGEKILKALANTTEKVFEAGKKWVNENAEEYDKKYEN